MSNGHEVWKDGPEDIEREIRTRVLSCPVEHKELTLIYTREGENQHNKTRTRNMHANPRGHY